jgi:hypothetical protein
VYETDRKGYLNLGAIVQCVEEQCLCAERKSPFLDSSFINCLDKDFKCTKPFTHPLKWRLG